MKNGSHQLRRIENLVKSRSDRTTKFPLPGENPSLQMLGRRMERLFLLGLLLMIVSFIEMYLTTANLQISQDRSAAAIHALISGIERNQKTLESLFKPQPKQQNNDVTAPVKRNEAAYLNARDRKIARTRKLLGLPPVIPKPKTPDAMITPSTKIETYREVLNETIDKAIQFSGVDPKDLESFRDIRESPSSILKRLDIAQLAIDKKTTSVWGIQTPRLVKLQYAGMDYQLPFGFLSTLLVATLPPLVAAWLSILYMTRQREIFEITHVQDFKKLYPHILNFVSVDFKKYSGNRQTNGWKGNRVFFTILRVLVILFIVAPICYANFYSFVQLQSVNENGSIMLIISCGFFAFYIVVQCVGLILQECIALGDKQFIEA